MLYKSHRRPQGRSHFAQGFAHLRGNFGFAEPPEDGKLQGLPLRLRQLIDHLVEKHQTIINQSDFLRLGQPG